MFVESDTEDFTLTKLHTQYIRIWIPLKKKIKKKILSEMYNE